MPTLADSDGLLASLFESGATYEVHGVKGGSYAYFLARVEGSKKQVSWLTPFETREHFPWMITAALDDGKIRVTIHGEHWKGGTQELFHFLFDPSTGGLVSSGSAPAR